MGHTVTIENTGTVLDCGAGQTLLQAAVLAGVDYPYTCATGNCAACVSDLKSGEVTMLAYSDNALTAAQRAAGRILACRARPVSDVTVEWLGRGRR
jgi:ferredoxin